ncbi:hypothetical protein LOD99_10843 [Oopsacas minuta]|uniref:Uncharacterized protein n=1 Tax=Oopsacas minuta TaxID=111878 RepID=A0AAV7KDY5_9METZ|nr:hypothetical protein LOD99_10843 [Oopsacas minuta]
MSRTGKSNNLNCKQNPCPHLKVTKNISCLNTSRFVAMMNLAKVLIVTMMMILNYHSSFQILKFKNSNLLQKVPKKRHFSKFHISETATCLEYHGSKPTKECITVKYIGEIDSRTSLACIPVYNISAEPPRYFTPGKEWERTDKV